jgi:hypothetical protein
MIGRNLLQCMSPLLALSGLSEMSARLSAFGAKADMPRGPAASRSDENDPERTLQRGTIGRSSGPSRAVPTVVPL